MLIVEGPDGAGKTRLVERLEQQLGITREPRAVSSDAVSMVPLDQWVLQELDRGFGPRIYDRFALISSPFYSMLPNPTFDGELRDREWLFDAWIKFRRVSPAIIVCLPPIEVVRQNVLKDESSRVMWDHIDTIYWLYHNFSCQYPFISHVWDYTQNEFDDLNFFLEQFNSRLVRVKRNSIMERFQPKGPK